MITRLLIAFLWSLLFTIYVVLVYIALLIVFLFWNPKVFRNYADWREIPDVYASIWQKSWSRI